MAHACVSARRLLGVGEFATVKIERTTEYDLHGTLSDKGVPSSSLLRFGRRACGLHRNHSVHSAITWRN
jgi:hypothetical protein